MGEIRNSASKRSQVFLIYEHKVRELESYKRIADCIESNYGISTEIFSQPFEVTDTIRAYFMCHPKVVVVPWGYTDTFVREFSPMFMSAGCPYIITLDCEQIYSEFNKLRYIPANEYSKHRIIHCAWGENFKELLVQNGADSRNVYITGNPRMDILIDKTNIEKSVARNKFAKEFDLNLKKKWMMFAESRGLHYSEDYINKYGQYGISIEENRKRTNQFILSLKKMIQQLHTIEGRFFEEYEFIYRVHPGQDAGDGIDSRIKIISAHSIYDWFPALDLLVSYNSSTLLEADAFGVPVIRYEDDTDPKYLCIGIDRLPYIRDFNELIGYDLEKYQSREIFKEYLGASDCKSIERISNLIFRIVNGDFAPFDPDINRRPLTRFTIRRFIAERIFRWMVYWNGPEGLKRYPSYNLKRDLPDSYKVRKGLKATG